MENKELLEKIQALADERAKSSIRSSELTLIHTEEKGDGSYVCYCLGADMPLLIYRIFYVTADGEVTEENDIQQAAQLSSHFNRDIRPTLDLINPALTESPEYEILVETRLENNGVEVKLKSSSGRDVTMVEIYRYFDFKSKVFFVSCIGLSFPGQYLFSVTPDSKHLRLILNPDENIQSRTRMLNELLAARLLPSYRTIADAAHVLNGDVKANVTLTDQNGQKIEFHCNFCYDDDETQTRFAFFEKNSTGDQAEGEQSQGQQGIIMVQDIFNNNQLSLINNWTEEQKAAIQRVQEQAKSDPEEFNKHCCSFFADDLDFRYNRLKAGTLTRTPAPEAPATPASETPAE